MLGAVLQPHPHVWCSPLLQYWQNLSLLLRHPAACGATPVPKQPPPPIRLPFPPPQNEAILHRYANEDVAVGSWLVGLDVEYDNQRRLCCDTEWKCTQQVGGCEGLPNHPARIGNGA